MTSDPAPTNGLLAPASTLRYTAKAVSFALLAGVGSGALMATIAPESKFSLVGWLIAPLWLLLEIYFELVIGVVGDRPKTIKYAAIVVLALGFYGTWFLLRS